MNKLEEIEKKLKKLKNKRKDLPNSSKINPKSYGMAMNVTIELITGIGLGVILGIMADNYLQSKPIMFIIFFIIGTSVGFYNMFRCLKKYGYFKK